MIDYEVMPHVGIGPVRLGMSAMTSDAPCPAPAMLSSRDLTPLLETDAFHENGFQVFYSGTRRWRNTSSCLGIPASCALYRGIDVFATPADVVVSHVARDTAFDPDHWELGYSYIFPALDLSLWRPVLPESPEDTDGREFSTIGIGVVGYYGVGLTNRSQRTGLTAGR